MGGWVGGPWAPFESKFECSEIQLPLHGPSTMRKWAVC